MLRLPLPAIFIWVSLGTIIGWWLHGLYSNPTTHATDARQTVAATDLGLTQGSEKATSKIDTLLKSGDYELALSRLNESLYFDEAEARRNRTAIVSSLAKLSSKEPAKAQPLLKQFLESDTYNPRAIFLLANAYLGTGQHMRALETLFELKRLSQAEVSVEEIDASIGKVESEYVKQLRDNEQLGELLQLYEFLTRNDPDNLTRFYKLAEIQQHLHHYYDALSSLNYVLFDPSWGKLAQSMAEKIQESIVLEDKIQIPLERSGNHFIVPMRINGIDGARMLIDTGASLCVLRPQSAQRFGLPTESDDRVTLAMATSIFNTPRIEIESLSVGDLELLNIKAAIVDLQSADGTDGLLGMNFLGEFNFFIDQTTEILYLSEK